MKGKGVFTRELLDEMVEKMPKCSTGNCKLYGSKELKEDLEENYGLNLDSIWVCVKGEGK